MSTGIITSQESHELGWTNDLAGLSDERRSELQQLLKANFSEHLRIVQPLLRFAWKVGEEGHEGQLHGTMLIFDPCGEAAAKDFWGSTAKLAAPQHSEGRPLRTSLSPLHLPIFTDFSDFLGRLPPSTTTTHKTLGTLGAE